VRFEWNASKAAANLRKHRGIRRSRERVLQFAIGNGQ
jgi:hypothetical protein